MTTSDNWDPDLQLKLTDANAPFTARDHQKAAWDRMSSEFNDKGAQAGLIVVPTGGGKTVIAVQWLLANHVRNGGRVLWLAHRRSLLRQAMNTFHDWAHSAYPKPRLHLATVTSEDMHWSNISIEHDVVLSSMQTAIRKTNIGFVQEFVNDAKNGVYVVVDEAHHAPAREYAELLRTLKKLGCKLLGLTATPVRTNNDDQKRLSSLFDGKVIYQISRRELTDRGILAAPAFETVKTNVNLEKDFTAEDYDYLKRRNELGPQVLNRLAKHAHRNALIVEHYKNKKSIYGSTIVFAANSPHAQTLSEEFQKAGLSADYVDYSRKDAHDIIEKYRVRKEPDVIINVEMLTEGFDAPHTRTVFIARPTRSESLLHQMVGRALRGKQSGGNDVAHLVTFLDTWEEFNVIDTEYVLEDAEDIVVELPTERSGGKVVSIDAELIREAYRILQSNVRGSFEGVYECLPHSWFAWTEVFEDDQQRRSVMVFSNQVSGYEALLKTYSSVESIPAEITEDVARALVRKFFADVRDPLPRWADIQALLEAKRKECEIDHYTFDEKKAFDPKVLAQKIVDDNLSPKDMQKYLQEVWDSNGACRSIYRQLIHSFFADVSREVTNIVSPPPPPTPPEVQKIVPESTPRPWPEGNPGYSLVQLRDSVLSVKKHFPNGAPLVRDVRWSNDQIADWGFFRLSEKENDITINCVLNSPDIPYFVLEYLMFHEMLHADMPSAGHNADFRDREQNYSPSLEALEDAKKRGIQPGPKSGQRYWYVAGDRFLGTFHQYYQHGKPGSRPDNY